MSDKVDCKRCSGTGNWKDTDKPCFNCEGTGLVGEMAYRTVSHKESKHPSMRFVEKMVDKGQLVDARPVPDNWDSPVAKAELLKCKKLIAGIDLDVEAIPDSTRTQAAHDTAGRVEETTFSDEIPGF